MSADAVPETPFLEIENLSVRYEGRSTLQAVSDVSLVVREDEVVGIVGESGCGKSTLARALLRLLPRDAVVSGRVRLRGRELTDLSDREFRSVRWAEISMIFQDAMNALNPVLRVGHQLVEAIELHWDGDRRSAEERSRELIEMVGLDQRVLDSFAHQLSGGMRQRVCIAMAFACDPALVLADEPTTALDVITQDRVIAEILDLQRRGDQGMIFISHDIALVSEISDRIGVMYAGHLVEFGTVRNVLYEASHPYTMGLLNAFPRADMDRDIVSIPGETVRLKETPNSCPFSNRCPFAEEICESQAPPLRELGGEHQSACHFSDRAEDFRLRAADPAIWRSALVAS